VVRVSNQDALFDPAGVAARISGLIGRETSTSTVSS
jgi:hypothetical protein